MLPKTCHIACNIAGEENLICSDSQTADSAVIYLVHTYTATQMHPYANLMKHDDVRHIFLEPSRQQVMKSEKHLGKSTKNEEVGLLLYAAYLGTYSYMYVWQYI